MVNPSVGVRHGSEALAPPTLAEHASVTLDPNPPASLTHFAAEAESGFGWSDLSLTTKVAIVGGGVVLAGGALALSPELMPAMAITEVAGSLGLPALTLGGGTLETGMALTALGAAGATIVLTSQKDPSDVSWKPLRPDVAPQASDKPAGGEIPVTWKPLLPDGASPATPKSPPPAKPFLDADGRPISFDEWRLKF